MSPENIFDKSVTKIIVSVCLIICIITCLSCKSKISHSPYPNATVFTRSDFQNKLPLRGELLYLDSLWTANGVYVYDSILLIVSGGNVQSALRLFNINNGGKIGEYIHIGRGPDELMTCSNIQFMGDYIWAIDKGQNKYLKYRKTKPFQDSFEKPAESITLKNAFLLYPLIIDSSRIIGINTYFPDKFLSFYNMEKQEIDTTLSIPYPVDIDGTGITRGRSFDAFKAADTEHIYVAYGITDLIDIYDKNGIFVKRLFGPEHFMPPVFSEIEVAGGKARMAVPEHEPTFAYTSPVITDDGLMVLYHGISSEEKGGLSNQIFLFSPSGEPLVEFSLDIPIFGFCVNDSIKRIYGLTNTPDYQVICFDYGDKLTNIKM